MNSGVPPREELLTEIHSLLCSTKGAITPKKLSDDYYQVTGNTLPFRKLGFTRLEDLLQTAPNVVKCTFDQGQMFVQAIPRKESAHIQDFVAKQRKAKTNKPKNSYYSARGRGGFGRPVFQQPALPPRMMITRSISNSGYNPHPPLRHQTSVPSSQPRSVVYVPPHSTLNQTLSNNASQRIATNVPLLSRPYVLQTKTPLLPAPPPQASKVTNLQPLVRPIPVPTKINLLPVNAVTTKTSNREQLKKLAEELNLGEIDYQAFSISKTTRKLCGKLALNKKNFSTYPREFDSEDEACEAVALEALEHFKTVVPSQKTAPSRKYPETTDPKLIAERVITIVSRNDQGFGYLSSFILDKYCEEYHERIPVNWVSLVTQVTAALTFHHIKENDYAVYLTRGEGALSSSESQESCQPIPAEFPDQDICSVHVLVIQSIDLVAVRLSKTEQFNEWERMILDLEMHYTDMESTLKCVSRMEQDKLYVACIENTYFRVKLDEIVEDDKVSVILVDCADRETVSLSNVFEILPRFCPVPCQGIYLRLFGLSDLGKSEAATMAAVSSVTTWLHNKEFVAQVVSRVPEVSVILYQTQGSDSAINLNELILSEVANEVPAQVIGIGKIFKVRISYISSQGDVFVITDNAHSAIVEAALSMVKLQADKLTPLKPSDLNPAAAIYLLESATHGWCRASLCSGLGEDGNVFVQLIDLGDVEIVPVGKLRSLANVSPLLSRIGGQATRVRLARVPPSPDLLFTDKTAQRLREIASPDSMLIMRVVELKERSVPIVEMFQRVGDNNIMGSINTTLEMESTLYRHVSENRNVPVANLDATLATLSLNRGAAGSLHHVPTLEIPPAQLPKTDCDFKVHVCNVSNPSAFFVQPVSTYDQLTSLMHSLQEYCRRPDVAPLKMSADQIKVGGVYAGLHNQTCLYHRVQVEVLLHGDYLVNFVDYGEKAVLQLSNLRPLTAQFCELPAQALKARLAGVQPLQGTDWGMKEVLTFKKIVEDKNLYSYVVGITADEVLQLHMIDTSGVIEVIISRYLVDQKLALLTPASK